MNNKIILKIGEKEFYIYEEEILEISKAKKIFPIPNAKSYIRGVTYYKENAVPVYKIGDGNSTYFIFVNLQQEVAAVEVDEVIKEKYYTNSDNENKIKPLSECIRDVEEQNG